jgi:addiction module RelE/StbE family toxin
VKQRRLIPSPAFLRAAKRAARKHPQVAENIGETLKRLAENAFDSRLRSHKLKGPLAGLWACSAGFDLRVVFEFVEHEGAEAILLHSVGSHEEVY